MASTVRALLVAVFVAAAVTLALYWRGTSPRPALAGPGPAPSRGGELVFSLRAEPGSYNRYVEATAATDIITMLMDGRLVRVDRVRDELVPWLAESWTQSADGLTYTLKLRPGVRFSDGVPFTSADVLFSFRALYDDRVRSRLATGISIAGQRLNASAPDASTVVITFPAPLAPGLRVLDNLPILPRHKLEAALDNGEFARAWTPSKPLTDVAGLGPFVLTEHVAGQRLVFSRNPHYWRHDDDGVQLPYVDRLTAVIIPDQTTEALRLEAGDLDLLANADIRPDDYIRFKRAADEGKLTLIEAGIGLDPNLLWFNLVPQGPMVRKPWLARKEFRQAISYAADRQVMANSVYLGAAIPIYGPITPGNRTWYTDSAPTYPHNAARARDLFASIGLSDRNSDGMLDDGSGQPVRFSVLVQLGHTIRERSAAVLQEQLRQVGVGVDVVGLDGGAMLQRWTKGDYEAIYHGVQASSTDPALNPDFWYSSGSFHFWNPHQPAPASEWERRIDELMRRQVVAPDLAERQRLFAEVQRIFGEELPAVYFVAPRVTLAHSARMINAAPALQSPQLLWAADRLAVTGPRR